MGDTLAATLAAIDQENYADVLFQSIMARPLLTAYASRHELTGGETVHFPNYSAIQDTDVHDGDDNDATTYTSLSPNDASATVTELHVAVAVSTFAQAVRRGADPARWVPNMIDALVVKLERKLIVEAVAHGSQSAGNASNDMDVDMLIEARSKFGAYPEQMAAWILNTTGENALISDLNGGSTSALGSAVAIVEGQVARILGAPVAGVSPYLASQKSLLVGKGVMNYAVAGGGPSFRVQYDPDSREDKVVATLVCAAKIVEVNHSVAVVISHT